MILFSLVEGLDDLRLEGSTEEDELVQIDSLIFTLNDLDSSFIYLKKDSLLFFKPLSKLNLGLNPRLLILLILGILIFVPPLAKDVFLNVIFFLKIFDSL